MVEAVQLRLGLAQIAYHTQQWSRARSLLAKAARDEAVVNVDWLRPFILYWQGMVQYNMGETAVAQQSFQSALRAVHDGGNCL
ncbi:MAG: hypothetical protein GY796_26300 [Chloroflexi bacterium]|nr:hypothetical protein [Chloroflexota bacterium]